MQHLALHLHLDWAQQQVYGSATLALQAQRPWQRMQLDAAHLTIQSITLNGQPVTWRYDGSARDGALDVDLQGQRLPGQPLQLRIPYRTGWVNHSEPGNIGTSTGLGLRWFTPTLTDPRKRRQVWASGDPRSARHWFPCIDDPSLWRSAELTATVERPLLMAGHAPGWALVKLRGSTGTDMSTQPPPFSAPAHADHPTTSSAHSSPWAVRLLGAVEARGQETLTHWPSRAAVLLLARLALAPDRIHPREELVELLWPGVALEVGRNRLRQVLSTLKSQLEPSSGAAVIQADRHAVRAAPGALRCDAIDFERCLRGGQWDLAASLYRGELLPGYYEDWVIEERNRLAALAERLQTMPALPAAPAAAKSLAAGVQPGQLPSFWTRLFGTEFNASRLRELVRHERLVTVLGAGGSGKTRLAVQAASALAEPAPWAPVGGEAPSFEQVVFVSLIDCANAPRALDAMAGALRVTSREPLKGIQQVLAGQRTLMLLDNCEQLVGLADAVLLQLLADNATLHLLVTSRARLGLPGEQTFELAGLPLPESTHRASVESLSGQAAVALFLDRAHAASAGFSLQPAQTGALTDLLRLLAGMPLAIELAASRMRSLSPQQLLDLLTAGQTPMLDLLAREPAGQGLAHRHASLRHVVSWSWQQLSPALMDVMQALSVFAAPAQAETVAAVAGLDPMATSGRLEQLRDHSLVVAAKDHRNTLRYVLLQPVREFVVERMPAAAAALLRHRMRQWLIDFALVAKEAGYRAIDRVDAELPHVHAAILNALADGPAAQTQAVALAVALRMHWEIDTRAPPPPAVVHALEAALPAVADPQQRCEAYLLLSMAKGMAGAAKEAVAVANQALALATDPRARSWALSRRAMFMLFSSDDHSGLDESLREALALAQAAQDLQGQATALRAQFLVASNRDDDQELSERLAQQGQALWERAGHRRNAYSALMDRASCWALQGRLDEAVTALAACEQAALQEGFATGSIMSSWQLGRASMKLRDSQTALAAFRRCLQQSWDLKRMAYVADAMVLVPGGLAFQDAPQALENAARLQGFAVPHWERLSGPLYAELARDVRLTRRWLFHRLGAVRLETLRMEGACLGLPDAVALALGS